MVDGTQTLERPWAEPGNLLSFIDELRQAGYNIDTGTYIAVQDLMLALAAGGDRLDDPLQLGHAVGPLVCSSPREQDEFTLRFEAWLTHLGWRKPLAPNKTPPATDAEDTDLARQVKAGERGGRRWLWLGAVGFTSLAVLLYVWYTNSTADLAELFIPKLGQPPPALPPDQGVQATALPRTVFFTVAAASALLLLWSTWRFWWRRRARLFLEQRAVSNEPELDRIPMCRLGAALFTGIPLFRAAQGLRRRIPQRSQDLDVDATANATARAVGWFTPVFATRQAMPEYLALVDRSHGADHQARLADELLTRLRAHEVFVARYYFDSDPRLCFPEGGGTPVTLQALSRRYRHHRLLLFSDGAGLFSPLSGELKPWGEQLLAWPERALFTPKPPAQWNAREDQLGHHFMLAPTSVTGLGFLAHTLSAGLPVETGDTAAGPPFPHTLRDQAERWVARDAPEPATLDRTLAALRRHVGDDGFRWLCALAVYPEVDWNVTLYLGHTLRTTDGDRLLTWERLTALAQLPWLRRGFMPEWLRLALIEQLRPAEELEVRQALDALLLNAAEGAEESDYSLQIAREHGGAFRALGHAVLRHWVRRATPDSPLRDHVFLRFMSGRRLALQLPRAFADWLFRHRQRALEQELPDLARARRLARWLGATSLMGLVALIGTAHLLPSPASDDYLAYMALVLVCGLSFAAVTLPYVARDWLVMLVGAGLAGYLGQVSASGIVDTGYYYLVVIFGPVVTVMRWTPRPQHLDTPFWIATRRNQLLALHSVAALLLGLSTVLEGISEMFSFALIPMAGLGLMTLGIYGRTRLLLGLGALPLLASWILVAWVPDQKEVTLSITIAYVVLTLAVNGWITRRLGGPGVLRTLSGRARPGEEGAHRHTKAEPWVVSTQAGRLFESPSAQTYALIVLVGLIGPYASVNWAGQSFSFQYLQVILTVYLGYRYGKRFGAIAGMMIFLPNLLAHLLGHMLDGVALVAVQWFKGDPFRGVIRFTEALGFGSYMTLGFAYPFFAILGYLAAWVKETSVRLADAYPEFRGEKLTRSAAGTAGFMFFGFFMAFGYFVGNAGFSAYRLGFLLPFILVYKYGFWQVGRVVGWLIPLMLFRYRTSTFSFGYQLILIDLPAVCLGLVLLNRLNYAGVGKRLSRLGFGYFGLLAILIILGNLDFSTSRTLTYYGAWIGLPLTLVIGARYGPHGGFWAGSIWAASNIIHYNIGTFAYGADATFLIGAPILGYLGGITLVQEDFLKRSAAALSVFYILTVGASFLYRGFSLETNLDELISPLVGFVSLLVLSPLARHASAAAKKSNPKSRPRHFDWDTFMNIGVSILYSTLLPTLIYFFTLTDRFPNSILLPGSTRHALAWTITAVLAHGIAIIAALFVFRFATRQPRYASQSQPTLKPSAARTFLVGCGGYVAGLLTFTAYSVLDSESGLEMLNISMWALLPATTAAFIGYHLDHYVYAANPRYSRLKGALLQGILTMFVSVLIVVLLYSRYSENPVLPYFLAFVALVSGLTGAGIGYTFPEGYKRTLRGYAENQRR